MKRVLAALLLAGGAVTVGIATPARAELTPFACSYSGKTTIQWHSDRLNKLGATEVRVTWLDSGDNVLNSVDLVL